MSSFSTQSLVSERYRSHLKIFRGFMTRKRYRGCGQGKFQTDLRTNQIARIRYLAVLEKNKKIMILSTKVKKRSTSLTLDHWLVGWLVDWFIDRWIDRSMISINCLWLFDKTQTYFAMLTRKCERDITSGDKTTSIYFTNCELCRKLEGHPISSLMINQNIGQKKVMANYILLRSRRRKKKKRIINAIRSNIHFYFPYLRTVYLHSIQRSRLTSTTKYKNNLSKWNIYNLVTFSGNQWLHFEHNVKWDCDDINRNKQFTLQKYTEQWNVGGYHTRNACHAILRSVTQPTTRKGLAAAKVQLPVFVNVPRKQ